MIDSSEIRLRVGQVIKEARIMKGLTQKQLGELINRSNNVITNWEKGTNSPDVDMIEKLCSILSIPVEKMFPFNKEVNTDLNLSESEKHLINSWRALSYDDQMKIMGMIELKLHNED